MSEKEDEGVATPQQWQSRYAHAVSNNGRARRIVKLVSTVNRSFREATERGCRATRGQAGRDFAVARRAITSEA